MCHAAGIGQRDAPPSIAVCCCTSEQLLSKWGLWRQGTRLPTPSLVLCRSSSCDVLFSLPDTVGSSARARVSSAHAPAVAMATPIDGRAIAMEWGALPVRIAYSAGKVTGVLCFVFSVVLSVPATYRIHAGIYWSPALCYLRSCVSDTSSQYYRVFHHPSTFVARLELFGLSIPTTCLPSKIPFTLTPTLLRQLGRLPPFDGATKMLHTNLLRFDGLRLRRVPSSLPGALNSCCREHAIVTVCLPGTCNVDRVQTTREVECRRSERRTSDRGGFFFAQLDDAPAVDDAGGKRPAAVVVVVWLTPSRRQVHAAERENIVGRRSGVAARLRWSMTPPPPLFVPPRPATVEMGVNSLRPFSHRKLRPLLPFPVSAAPQMVIFGEVLLVSEDAGQVSVRRFFARLESDLQKITPWPNFTVLYILEPESFLHCLLHRCEVPPYLTELPMIGAHNCEVFSYWHRVTQGVSNRVWSNDKRNAEDKLDFKHSYISATFAIGSQFIRHARVNSKPITDLIQKCEGPRWRSGQTTRLPPRRSGFDTRRGRFRIFACGNLTGRCRWSAGFLRGLTFPPPLHSGSCSTLTSLHPHRLALKTSMLRAAQISPFSPEAKQHLLQRLSRLASPFSNQQEAHSRVPRAHIKGSHDATSLLHTYIFCVEFVEEAEAEEEEGVYQCRHTSSLQRFLRPRSHHAPCILHVSLEQARPPDAQSGMFLPAHRLRSEVVPIPSRRRIGAPPTAILAHNLHEEKARMLHAGNCQKRANLEVNIGGDRGQPALNARSNGTTSGYSAGRVSARNGTRPLIPYFVSIRTTFTPHAGCSSFSPSVHDCVHYARVQAVHHKREPSASYSITRNLQPSTPLSEKGGIVVGEEGVVRGGGKRGDCQLPSTSVRYQEPCPITPSPLPFPRGPFHHRTVDFRSVCTPLEYRTASHISLFQPSIALPAHYPPANPRGKVPDYASSKKKILTKYRKYQQRDNAPHSCALNMIIYCILLRVTGATVAERLPRSPPTKANRAQFPAGSPDFRLWGTCRTMPFLGGSSRESPVPHAHSFRRRSTFTSITLIGSQDLAAKSRPNLLHSHY
ncbi:hypothetical protein PR048_022284, partial [Dryococelus australis]